SFRRRGRPPPPHPFPYTTLFRSDRGVGGGVGRGRGGGAGVEVPFHRHQPTGSRRGHASLGAAVHVRRHRTGRVLHRPAPAVGHVGGSVPRAHGQRLCLGGSGVVAGAGAGAVRGG